MDPNLMSCPTCGHSVSNIAAACTYCGGILVKKGQQPQPDDTGPGENALVAESPPPLSKVAQSPPPLSQSEIPPTDKISDAMKKQFPALPAANTTDRATLNAAAGRVLGNPKIPDLNFSVPAAPSASELTDRLNQLYERFTSLQGDAAILEGRIARTRIPEFINEQYDNLDVGEQLLSDVTGIKNQLLSLQREAESKDPPVQFVVSQIARLDVDSVIKTLETALDKLRQRLAAGSQA